MVLSPAVVKRIESRARSGALERRSSRDRQKTVRYGFDAGIEDVAEEDERDEFSDEEFEYDNGPGGHEKEESDCKQRVQKKKHPLADDSDDDHLTICSRHLKRAKAFGNSKMKKLETKERLN